VHASAMIDGRLAVRAANVPPTGPGFVEDDTPRADEAHQGTERDVAKKTKAGPRKAKKRSGKLAPRKEQRGLDAASIMLGLDAPEIVHLVQEVREAGGAAIAAYREPLSGRPLLL